MCFLGSEIKMFVKDGPSTLIGWAFVEGTDVFYTFILAAIFCLSCVGVGVFILYTLDHYLGASFYYIYSSLLIRKKKEGKMYC